MGAGVEEWARDSVLVWFDEPQHDADGDGPYRGVSNLGECSYVTVSETELTHYSPFCPLPCSRWHVLYFEPVPSRF